MESMDNKHNKNTKDNKHNKDKKMSFNHLIL